MMAPTAALCWHQQARHLPMPGPWAHPFSIPTISVHSMSIGKSQNAHTSTCRAVHDPARQRAHRFTCRAVQDPEEEGSDLVEQAVQFLFGKKALQAAEPFGMKRMSDEAYAEQSVATTTELAAPVDGDSQTVAMFRPLLAKTRLERAPLRQAYSAAEDGWSAAAFHAAVDTFGAAVVLGTTVGGSVFGAYNPRGWIGLGDERNAMSAFLFCWPDGDVSRPAQKLVKVGGAGLAIIDKADAGPQFGAEGLSIALQPGQEHTAKSRLGSYYAKRADGGRSLFAPGEEKGAQLTDLKVFVAEGDPEQWSLDGIVWKSSGT